MIDSGGRVAEDPDPDESPQRQDEVRVVASGSEAVRARLARPQLGTGRFLEHPQPAAVVGMRLRVQEHFDVLDVEAELRDARHDHWRGAGIAAIEHDVPRGPGDEERRDIIRADVVQIARDAERFDRRLSAPLRRIQPPADEYQRKNTRQSQQDYEPGSLGKIVQQFLSLCDAYSSRSSTCGTATAKRVLVVAEI